MAGYVSAEFVEEYNGEGGSASGASLSATSLTIHQYQSVRLDGSVTSNISAMRWESSNPNVVSPAIRSATEGTSRGPMLYGNSPGTATITFHRLRGDGPGHLQGDGHRGGACALCLRGQHRLR